MSDSPDHRLRVAVLGPVRAWLGDHELTLGPARQRTLFAVLAANANRIVRRDELIEAIWGPAAPATATGSVYTYISGLRRNLGAPRSPHSAADNLTSTPAGYALRLDEGALDAEEFARLRTLAHDRLDNGDRTAAVQALERAMSLWQGVAFTGATGPFVEVERQRLADTRVAVAEQRARIMLELGKPDEVVAELTGLVREHPLHEPFYELLMLALYYGGRQAEALTAYRDARHTLVGELGVEPGEALRRLHRQILDGTVERPRPAPETTDAAPLVLSVVPAQVTRALQEGLASRPFVGRAAEVNLLRGLVDDVLGRQGRSVWIEGEPGIGKSELLTIALGDAVARGSQLAWSIADPLGQRIPLQAIMECLGIDAASADPRGAALARQLHGDQARGWAEEGQAPVTEKIVAYVRELCASAPLVLVIDDLQWADEASVLLWGRLAAATRQLPLLLVAATRPEPTREELAQLRRGVEARQGHVLALRPLSAPDVESLFGTIVGARPGASLRALAPRTAGNPLYAREMAAALVRQTAVRVVDGTAEVDLAAADEVPESLLEAVRGTLSFLSEDTTEVLRLASLLGNEFAVDDIAALSGRSAFDLVSTFEEAVAMNVVVDAQHHLAFRHPFLRQALYDGMSRPVRVMLRRHAAEALATAGAAVTLVAEQLTAEPIVVDPWVVTWLADSHAGLIHRAPAIASDLLRQALDTDLLTPDQRETLLVALVKLLFGLDLKPEVEAEQALRIATDPADRAEMRQLLAAMRYRRGEEDDAIELLASAVNDRAVPEIWRVRHRALLANFRRGGVGNLERAERAARIVHQRAVADEDPYSTAHALQTLWLINSIRRDHQRALGYVDEALAVVRRHHDPRVQHFEEVGLYLDLLDNRIFSLQNLDRLADAEATLQLVPAVGARHRLPAGLQVAAAVQHYWAARWDDALAELGTVNDDAPGVTFHGMREPGAASLLMHGVAALVAVRRGDRAFVAAHLDASESQFLTSTAERESCDFLLVARALVAEQDGRPRDALDILLPILRPAYAPMMLRHQWLPEVARLALDAGERDVAEEALAVCTDEAAKETVPARAFAAAARCRALVTGDPDPALAAADHYRSVGRRLEWAATLEDAAVLLARGGRRSPATAAAREAVRVFADLAAKWDISRAERRLSPLGVPGRRPGPPHLRVVRGWSAG